jgi:hypothetical protein
MDIVLIQEIVVKMHKKLMGSAEQQILALIQIVLFVQHQVAFA